MEIHWLSEMTLVGSVTTWERFAFETMLVRLHRDTSRLAETLDLPLPHYLPVGVCEAILAGVRYFDPRSVEELKGAARRYLVPAHNPFERVPAEAARRIDEAVKIRDFVVHRSRHAERAFLRVLERREYQRFVPPGRFLVASDAGGKPRLLDYLDAMREASRAMEGEETGPSFAERVRETVEAEAA